MAETLSQETIAEVREPLRAYIQSIVDGWDALRKIEHAIGQEIEGEDLADALSGDDLPSNIGLGTCTWPTAADIPASVIDEFAAKYFAS